MACEASATSSSSSVWLTTQPMDEPERASDLPVLFDQLGMDDRICFATDYPHWDFDSPERAIPKVLGEERRRLILRDNAHALYRLDAANGA